MQFPKVLLGIVEEKIINGLDHVIIDAGTMASKIFKTKRIAFISRKRFRKRWIFYNLFDGLRSKIFRKNKEQVLCLVNDCPVQRKMRQTCSIESAECVWSFHTDHEIPCEFYIVAGLAGTDEPIFIGG